MRSPAPRRASGRLARALGPFRGVPWAGNYPAAAALVLLALCPFLVLTTATTLMRPLLMEHLGATAFQLQLTAGLGNAGYAFGAVLAADLTLRLQRRHVYLIAQGGFVLASVLALIAPVIYVFSVGMVLQGLFTGILLVVALPPLITTHGVERLPTTAAIVSLGLFGVVTIGPLVGGIVGSVGGWRLLFTIFAILAAIGLGIGVLTFERNEPPNRSAGFDWLAIPPALGATVLPFFGVSWLSRSSFGHAAFLAPLALGLLLGVLLVASQYRKATPLMPVRPISSTFPVAGTAGAMIVGASFTALIELSEAYLLEVTRYEPARIGGLLITQLAGVLIAALLLRQALPTKWTPYLALSGLVGVAAGGVVLLFVTSSNAGALMPAAAFCLGYGAGAGVAPGLFLAGLSTPAARIGATFALVELLRSEAAFLVGPILLHVAMTSGFPGGFRLAVGITLIVVVAGMLLLLLVFLLGGVLPHRPRLEEWMRGGPTAYRSPPLLANVRNR
ncbi:MFS transporter [Streptomyces hoynatensis]|uniref:MFS transporter n=1 Tax=Streptomyces hoynatensis TaxID=1141874 RepID=A0A3A9YWL1_9ACTN|nr:MFS transporter [Streptomyces hoynatensis]RKN40423.1 MFS transporter [Streptomyces hoynatensis]